MVERAPLETLEKPDPRRTTEQYAAPGRLQSSTARRPKRRHVRRALTGSAAIELGAMTILAVIYNSVRATGGNSRAVAMAHARGVAHLEGPVFDHLELALNHWIVGWPVVAIAACYFYAVMHYLMTPTILVLSRRRGGWPYWRGYWALVVGSGIALFIYANWPLAPPRLMPELGTIDVMRHFADAGWWGDAASAPRGLGDATNQFAAMPSLHFGWSLWCGIQMWSFGELRWRIAAVSYPALQAAVVLATANHFLLDVLGGATCILAGYAVVTLVARARGTERTTAVGRQLEPTSSGAELRPPRTSGPNQHELSPGTRVPVHTRWTGSDHPRWTKRECAPCKNNF